MNKIETKLRLDISIAVEKFAKCFNSGIESEYSSLNILDTVMKEVIEKYSNNFKEWYILARFDSIITTHDYLTKFIIGILGCNSPLIYVKALSEHSLTQRFKTIKNISRSITVTIFYEDEENPDIKLSLFLRKIMKKYTEIYLVDKDKIANFYNQVFKILVKSIDDIDSILECVHNVLNTEDSASFEIALHNKISPKDITELAIDNMDVDAYDDNDDAFDKLVQEAKLIIRATTSLNNNLVGIICQIITMFGFQYHTVGGDRKIMLVIQEILHLILLGVNYNNLVDHDTVEKLNIDEVMEEHTVETIEKFTDADLRLLSSMFDSIEDIKDVIFYNGALFIDEMINIVKEQER